jgi:hypothetical protein
MQLFHKRQKKTKKQLWLNEWIKHGGVWSRPQAKAVYDGLGNANTRYTSIHLTTLLRNHGKLIATTQIENRGHKVQVWVLSSTC